MNREEIARMIAFSTGENGTFCEMGAVHERLYGDKANCYSDNNFSYCSHIKALTDKIIKHEQDTLKEFVEWYSGRLNKILKHEEELYESATKNNHKENATFFLGEKEMLERLLHWLDKDLENFLKERENGR